MERKNIYGQFKRTIVMQKDYLSQTKPASPSHFHIRIAHEDYNNNFESVEGFFLYNT